MPGVLPPIWSAAATVTDSSGKSLASPPPDEELQGAHSAAARLIAAIRINLPIASKSRNRAPLITLVFQNGFVCVAKHAVALKEYLVKHFADPPGFPIEIRCEPRIPLNCGLLIVTAMRSLWNCAHEADSWISDQISKGDAVKHVPLFPADLIERMEAATNGLRAGLDLPEKRYASINETKVYHDGLIVDERIWLGGKPRLLSHDIMSLLSYIILHNGTPVDVVKRERGYSTEGHLQTQLSRLRKKLNAMFRRNEPRMLTIRTEKKAVFWKWTDRNSSSPPT